MTSVGLSQMNKRIFIIDDDPDMVKTAMYLLKGEGYGVEAFDNPVDGLKQIRREPPDLLLLDLNLPELDGFEVCRTLKADPKLHDLPILMISVKSDEADVVAGLELGAEDYINKPFRKRELLARVRTVFRRRAKEPPARQVEAGPFRVDFGTYKAWADGALLTLTPKEFELFGFLLRREGRVLTRQTISENVWGVKYDRSMQTIEYHMHQLRKKLGAHGGCIKGLKGVGYRFEATGGADAG